MSFVTLLEEPPRRVRVGKVLAVARNYAAHAREMGSEAPTEPVFFLKPATSILEEGAAIVLPSDVGRVEHEVELAVLLGDRLSRATAIDALAAVAGYGVAIDVTARDLQKQAKEKGMPWTSSKGFDTFCPVSAFVPAPRLGDPQAQTLRLLVNNEVRQEGSTALMVHDVPTLLAAASRMMTLESGDVLLTGTPEGVGPLAAGDRARAEVVGQLAVEFSVERLP